MKKLLICWLLCLLAALGGCGKAPSDPPWLPVEEDYLRMQTARWEASVMDGAIQKSEITFPIGGGFFKKACYSAQRAELDYTDAEFCYYGRLTNATLPALFDAVDDWMGDIRSYRISYQDLDQDEQAAFDHTLPTALCDLKEMKVKAADGPYAGEWSYGVLYICDAAGEQLLWQIILSV